MSKLIAIDAGHGMKTAGKRCLKSIDSAETREWWLNDRIADMVEEELNTSYDCQVLRVDDTTGVKDISLSQRVKTANGANADIYISIHHNAGINGESGGGTVVYYYSDASERLVQARALYQEIVKRTGLSGNRSQVVNKYGFYVIKKTKMPAFLIENGFMDSKTDTPIILTKEHAQRTAEGIIAFVADQLKLRTRQKKESDATGKLEQTEDEVRAAEKEKVAQYYPACEKKYTTISAALSSIGVNCSYSFRRKIAVENMITGYVGSTAQNTYMLNLLKSGMLKRIL